MTLNELNGERFFLGEVAVQPLDITHGKLPILGYRLNDIAYITDCSAIPAPTREKLKGLDLLILNALGHDPHPTHFCLSEALQAITEIKPRRALLTHINHKFDHQKVSGELPENVELAYDGLSVPL